MSGPKGGLMSGPKGGLMSGPFEGGHLTGRYRQRSRGDATRRRTRHAS